jgi:uncharacterized SAM-binding protein YcdF (DUF218 family)
MTYIQPLLLLVGVIICAGLVRISSSKGKRVAICGVAGLLLISWPPLDWLLGLPLESGYPVRPFEPLGRIEAIVVLASSIRPPENERPYSLPDADTFGRCEYAAWIYRRWGPLPVLACEGRGRPAEGSLMAGLLRRSGVSADSIWVDDRSRSTRENALFGAAILRAHGIKRIALVVDAQSMPRASACFRKEGLDVAAAPTEFRALGNWRDELLPSWRAVRRNETTLHEVLGLAWYRLLGWV